MIIKKCVYTYDAKIEKKRLSCKQNAFFLCFFIHLLDNSRKKCTFAPLFE
ncbi:hypothetical protein HMPREF6485_2177 [Segatella buccae ATCC 33574]|uniref:Uncharacterized protein n=1 Tax=Segatella buccae ATCC 33574 TaxID=873513 RepID=E6K991_9BACT|nr:hypothetical protein HMPREF6485_2177 [Segatella buccae ATCC 33574]